MVSDDMVVCLVKHFSRLLRMCFIFLSPYFSFSFCFFSPACCSYLVLSLLSINLFIFRSFALALQSHLLAIDSFRVFRVRTNIYSLYFSSEKFLCLLTKRKNKNKNIYIFLLFKCLCHVWVELVLFTHIL